MAPPAPKPAPKRRARKRNRRVASDSSDSSSSDGSSSSEDEAPLVPALLAAAATQDKGKGKEILPPAASIAAALAAREEESSGSESDSSSSSDDSYSNQKRANPSSTSFTDPSHPSVSTRIIRPPRKSTSPSPPPSAIPAFLPFDKPPSFLPKAGGGDKELSQAEKDEEEKKKTFRGFWMGKLVEGFGNDLDVVREEPTLTTPRLTLLINSLTSGIDVFSTGSSTAQGTASGMDVDEREVVLGRI